MKKRMNITIEEDIYNRLEPFKDSLNISKICENAITVELKAEGKRFSYRVADLVEEAEALIEAVITIAMGTKESQH